MKIKMLEHFQGSGLPTLSEGKEYELKNNELSKWLIEHRKAIKIAEPKVEQPKEESVEVSDEDFAEMMKSEPVEKKAEPKADKSRRKK